MKKAGILLILQMLTALLVPLNTHAGYIEVKDGKTIIHVTVTNLPNPADTSANARADVAVVRQFCKKFPEIFAKKYKAKYQADPEKYGNYNWDNVEVILDKFFGIKVEGVENDLLPIAANTAADILYINFRKSDTYIRNNFIQPLDNYFKELTPEQIKERIHPKIMPVCHRKGPDGKMHWWTMPYGGITGRVLVYRKDIFEECNIKPPDKNWTWKDLYEACRKITDPAKGRYGIRFHRGNIVEAWWWITFLWSAGGEIMHYDPEKKTWLCTFDSDAAVKALDFYVRLSAELWIDKHGRLRRGYAYKDPAEASDKWERGEIAMTFIYVEGTLLSNIEPSVTGMAPVPLGPGNHRGSEINSKMYGLYSQIKSPVIRDAAWEYMLYYDSLPAQRLRTKIMVEGGMGQFLNPTYLKKFGYNEILKLVPKGWEETFKIAIETGQPEPYEQNSNFAYDMMGYPLLLAEDMERNNKLAKVGSKEREQQLKKILVNACNYANKIMVGKISPQLRFWQRVTAWVMLLALIIGAFFLFRKIFRLFTPPQEHSHYKGSWQFKRYFLAYMLLIPAVVSIALWYYVPLIRGSYMAFFDYKIIGDSTFILVDNFADLLWSWDWWQSLWNALRYSLLTMLLTFAPPIILAIFLQEVPHCKVLLRILFYLPAVVTGLVTTLLWKQFFEGSEYGLVNRLVMNIPAIGFIAIGIGLLAIFLAFTRRLKFYEFKLAMWLCIIIGLVVFYNAISFCEPIFFQGRESFWSSISKIPGRLFECTPLAYQWLSNSNTAMLACIVPIVWAGMGPGCLIYLAALKSVPDNYYEAADIDGATFIDKIIFVIFPTLKPLIIINFVGMFIYSWVRSTGQILAMTGGAANTKTAGLNIWYKAFTYLQMGSATAMAWMLGFMLIGFTVYQLQILSKVEFKTAEKNK